MHRGFQIHHPDRIRESVIEAVDLLRLSDHLVGYEVDRLKKPGSRVGGIVQPTDKANCETRARLFLRTIEKPLIPAEIADYFFVMVFSPEDVTSYI